MSKKLDWDTPPINADELYQIGRKGVDVELFTRWRPDIARLPYSVKISMWATFKSAREVVYSLRKSHYRFRGVEESATGYDVELIRTSDREDIIEKFYDNEYDGKAPSDGAIFGKP